MLTIDDCIVNSQQWLFPADIRLIYLIPSNLVIFDVEFPFTAILSPPPPSASDHSLWHVPARSV